MEEEKLKAIQPTCNVSYYEQHLSGLHLDIIKYHLEKFSYSYEVMDAARCIANCLTYEKGMMSQKERFREFVVSLLETTNIDSYHHEYCASFEKFTYHSDGIFSIKSCAEGDDRSIYREALLCLGILNKFRHNFHTFKFVFDTIPCSPVVDFNGEFSVCTTDGSGYLICENVPELSLHDFLEDCTLEQFIKIYFIIILSLKEAFDVCNLTVYNLIPTNIKLKQTDVKTYMIGGYCVESEFIPIIHDLNMAYFTYQGEHFFSRENAYTSECLRTDKPFPMYDCFKLAMSSAYSLKVLNNENVDLTKVLKYFGLNKSTKIQSNFIKIERLFGRDHAENLNSFISYLIRTFKIDTNNYLEMQFRPSISDELKVFGLNGFGDLNFIHFYDLYNRNPRQAKNNFNLDDQYPKEIETINEIKNKLVPMISIDTFARNRAFKTTAYKENLKRRFYRFLIYFNYFMSYKLHYEAMIFVYNLLIEDKIESNINHQTMFNEIMAMKANLEKNAENILHTKEIVKIDCDRVKQPVVELGDFAWYEYGYNLLMKILCHFEGTIQDFE